MELSKILSADMAQSEIDKLVERKNTIAETITEKRGVFDSADVETRDSLLAEMSALTQEADTIDADIAEITTLRDKFAEQEQRMSLMKNVETVKVEERKKMEHIEKRSTPEYAKAWADYVRRNVPIPAELRDDTPTPGIFTTMDNIPIPTLMQSYVETAWERFGKFSRICSRISVKGYFKVPLELDADAAAWHAENAEAPAEEAITLGAVLLSPKMIKKWLSLTDEVMAMSPEEFMRYVADEIVYRIILVLDHAIISRTDLNGEGVIGIVGNAHTEVVNAELSFNAVNEAIAKLITFDNLTVAMHPETFYKNVMGLTDTVGRPIYQIATDNTGKPAYYINGQRIEFTTALKAYDECEAGDTWAVVGDFRGYKLNFPEGDVVRTLFDPYTLATADKARMIGRLYVAGNVVRLKHFAQIQIPASV